MAGSPEPSGLVLRFPGMNDAERRSLAAKQGWQMRRWKRKREEVIEPSGARCWVPPCPFYEGTIDGLCSRCRWAPDAH